MDIGGTFTDVAAIDSDGAVRIGKRLTSVGSEADGVIAGAMDCDVPLAEVGVFTHGTTLVINALLERKGAAAAIITTKGFRDVHELGRGNRPDIFNAFFRREPPLIPRHLRFELDERVVAPGVVVRSPLDEELAGVASRLRESGVEAVAIVLFNSYLNPANEEQVAAYLSRHLPDVFVTASSSISRQWREYERSTTTAANAYVAPLLGTYLGSLTGDLETAGFDGRFIVVDSNAGALDESLARRYPVRMIESGPVAGVISAAKVADSMRLSNLVTLDMGGTTAKTCVVEDGRWLSTDLYWIGGYKRGFPVQSPTVDIVEVGAGGGSIAWVDEAGRLRVGPRSAGASPGPACYGRGGTDVTVTDANVYCGRVTPNSFLGDFRLAPDDATQAMEALAAKISISPRRLALGILELANLSTAAAVRKQTVERGRDPREFTLLAFGGAGPMHAWDVARRLGFADVLIPPHPGHFSALGMLVVSPRFDRREVFLAPLEKLEPAELSSRLARMAAELAALPGMAGSDDASSLRYAYGLAMRYEGQEHTVMIRAPFRGLEVPASARARLRTSFEDEYSRRFGHVDDLSQIEVVEVEVVAEHALPTAPLTSMRTASNGRQGGPWEGSVIAFFDENEQRTETPFLWRQGLKAGHEQVGPLVVYEEGAHTVVPPGASLAVLDGGFLRLRATG